MNDSKKTIKQLVYEVLEELKKQGYSKTSVNNYHKTYRGLLDYAAKESIENYCEAVGLNYMHYQFGFKLEGFYGTFSQKVSESLRHLLVLWHYQQHRTISFITRVRKKPFSCPGQFQKEYDSFLSYCARKKYTVMGLPAILKPVQNYLRFLDENGISSLKEINASHFSSFLSIYIGCSQRYVCTIISGIKIFLINIYDEGLIEEEKWKMLPGIKYVRNAFIPPSWIKENVLKLLEAVDRGNPMGKRDYALLLMVVRLGLRASDIRNLSLKNLDWIRKKVVIVQTKTRQTLELSLLDDVGWALIDYLKNGRPKTKAETVFVNHKAPYGSFKETNGLQQILWKYMGIAELEIPKNEHCGLHSLRSTLARTMLEQGATLPVISEVLGHESIQTTSIYLKINIDELRKCAIDPDEVFAYEK